MAYSPNDYIKTYEDDTVIIQEGEMHDNTIYILNEGVLGVFKNDQIVAQIKQRGAIIGEMSVLLNSPRTATIKALTECSVIAIPFDLDTMFAKFPSIARKLMITLAKRLKDTTMVYEKTVQNLHEMKLKMEDTTIEYEKTVRDLRKMKLKVERFSRQLSEAQKPKKH